MATGFCNSTSIVHFRYPSQRATATPLLGHFQKTTANPVLGHATIKLLKPLHVTRRTGVRALHNSCRSETGVIGREGTFQDCQGHIISGQRVKYDCEDEILNILESNRGTNLTNLAEDLSNMLKHIGTHGEKEGGLVHLYKKILTPVHISRMWEIAGYNYTDKAADMLNHLALKWGGKSVNLKEGILDRKRKRGDEDLQEPLKQFPLKDEWKMEIHDVGRGGAYRVIFKGKRGWFPGNWERGGLVFVEKNLNRIAASAEPIDLALHFGVGGPWPSDHFVINLRAAGPNVLIGQAWTGGKNSERLWAETVLVTRK